MSPTPHAGKDWHRLDWRTPRQTGRPIGRSSSQHLAWGSISQGQSCLSKLYQSIVDGKKMVDVLIAQNIVPGIKVDKGLVPLADSNDESCCQGLDGLASRCAAYYQQGARFAKWRTVISIPNGPSALAVKDAAWGLAR